MRCRHGGHTGLDGETTMMRRVFWVMASMLLFAGTLRAQDPPPVQPVLDAPAAAAALARAEAQGRAVFLHDLAAERATDALMAEHRPARKDKRVRGWITEQHGDSIAVSFIDGTPAVLYRVRLDTRGASLGPVEVPTEPTPLTLYEAGAVQARSAAMGAEFQACGEKYNSVVLPASEDGSRWTVYLLPATTRPDVVPLGGSYRMDVVDGRVAGSRAFTRSCIQLGRGREVEAMMVTHLMDPTPTEVHVHWSLWARKPMFVGTSNGLLWNIEDGRIRQVEDDPQDPPRKS